MSQSLPEMETLSGIVERVTYHNSENGYTVAKLKIPREHDLVTLIGNFAQINAGESVRARGHWGNHPKHGPQFKAVFVDVVAPATVVGLEKYLGSGLIKGVGPVTAKRMVKHFGAAILDIIEQDPERLHEVPGVGPQRIRMVIRAWTEHKAIKNVMVFLQGHGVSTTYAVKIYKTYGDDSINVVSHEPYRLAEEIWGIGFVTADKIARALGMAEDDPGRLRAGLLYALNQAAEDGHVFLTRPELVTKTAEELKIEPTLLPEAMARMIEDRALIADPINAQLDAIYLPAMYYCEVGVAKRLRSLLSVPPELDPETIAERLEQIEAQEDFQLSDGQREAVLAAVRNRCFILTGGPGTGKTTVTRTIVRMWESLGKEVLLASPTGRAAKRLSEVTGGEAKTLHRLLSFAPDKMAFEHNQENPLACDVVVVDEASMLDLTLTNSLLKAIPDGAQVLFVGDSDQLPSVGAGRVLQDMLESGVIPHVRLTEVFRQAARSLLVQNAHRINRGEMPTLVVPDGSRSSDSYFVPVEDPQDIGPTIAKIVGRSLPKRFGLHPREDLQVLCPMNRGAAGAHALNGILQDALNPISPGSPTASFGGKTFRIGDKVLQLRNNYDKQVFNGDTGTVVAIDLEAQEVQVAFWDQEVTYEYADLGELALAYAISVHKSQGSEYPAVVMPVTTQHFPMLMRNLLYTGFTRAKKLVVLVGTKRAIGIALRNTEGNDRCTRLQERLVFPEF
ncbi:MAG TPA: ATP-dependent RecD-like DNA helicase [Stenomitos sp.]